MYQKQIDEICKDEMFVKGLLAMETSEDIQAALCEKEFTVSLEEAEAIQKALKELKNDRELSLDELEQVAGGDLFGIFGIGVAVGAAIGNIINNIRGK